MAENSGVAAAQEKRERLARLLRGRASSATPRYEPEAGFGFSADYAALKRLAETPAPAGASDLLFIECDGLNASTASVSGRELLNFSSYNYIGMSGEADVSAAAKAAIDRYGTSVSASRVVSGQRPLHRQLEGALAEFLATEAALVFVGGFSTNQSVVGHLFGPEDLIFYDSLIHSSIQQGAKQSGATLVPFPHNNPGALDNILDRRRSEGRRALIAIEGVYSMDGDVPDLPRFIELKTRHKALLMVDEAHSIGTLGATGRGLAEFHAVSPGDVDIWMGTLSKALASCGGYIAGTRELIDYLRLTTPGFVYSVGLTPPDAAAALAALVKLKAEPQRVQRLNTLSEHFRRRAREHGLDTGSSHESPVVPIMIGDSRKAIALSCALKDRGILALPIGYPAVPNNTARLRFFISSTHDKAQIDETLAVTAQCLMALG